VLTIEGPIIGAAGSIPFETSWLADDCVGHDLSPHEYLEEEYLVSGESRLFGYDAGWRLTVARPRVPFVTRMLVRRPRDERNWSGVVQMEPLHETSGDATWRRIAPYVMREGHAHVAVQTDPANQDVLRGIFDPERYRALRIPTRGLGWDLVAELSSLLRSATSQNPFPRPAQSIYLSGWSQTGSFVRTFLGEGFHERGKAEHGGVPFDGYIIGISSGAHYHLRGGYRAISDFVGRLPRADGRRIVTPHGVPVFEVLSENEAEAHWPALRVDSDSPEDPYRLYQVAGMSHVPEPAVQATQTGGRQLSRLGLAGGGISTLEERGAAPSRFVVSALYDLLDGWAREDRIPLRAKRMAPDPEGRSGEDPVHREAQPLLRDDVGNVLGGVRSCAVDVPLASYYPHSTPSSGFDDFASAAAADLIGSQQRFSPSESAARYPGTAFSELTRARAAELVAQRWLLEADARNLVAAAEATDLVIKNEQFVSIEGESHE
jgi:hypothetical protein